MMVPQYQQAGILASAVKVGHHCHVKVCTNRSQSWSSLSRKSMYESQQQISSVMNPVSNSMSYSEVSLAESPVDLTSQLQRF